MEDSVEVNAMCQERHDLRLEIIAMEQAVHHGMVGFITTAGVASAIYAKPELIKDPIMHSYVLFALGQVEIFMVVYGILLVTNINVHAGYVRALEARINELCRRNVSLWETEVTKNFLAGPKAAATWISLVFFVMLLVLFYYLVSPACATSILLKALAVIEAIAVIGFFIWTTLEAGRVTRYVGGKFKAKIDVSSGQHK